MGQFDQPITLFISDNNGVSYDSAMDDRTKVKDEIASHYKKFLIPTIKLTNLHHLVIKVQNYFFGKNANREGYISSDSNQYLSITVMKQKIQVAIRIFNSFINLAAARGHFVFVKDQNTIYFH